jgi:hypothetical protein
VDRRLLSHIGEGILLSMLGGGLFVLVHGVSWEQWLVLVPGLVALGVVLGLLMHWALD